MRTHLNILQQRRNHNVGEEHQLLQLLGSLQAVPLTPAASHETCESLAGHGVQDLLGQAVRDAQLLLCSLHTVPVVKAEAVYAGIDGILNCLQPARKVVCLGQLLCGVIV